MGGRRAPRLRAGVCATGASPAPCQQQQRADGHDRRPAGLVPGRPHAGPQRRIEALVLERVGGHVVGFQVAGPGVVEHHLLRVKAGHPGRVAAQQFDHAVDQALAFGAIWQHPHALEGAVELGIGVVAGVLAAVLDLAVGAVEQEQEIFRVRVVGVPAPLVNLRLAAAHLVLEAVVVGAAHHQLHAQLAELLAQPVHVALGVRAAGHGVEVQHQRPAADGIAPVGVTGRLEQCPGALDAQALRPARLPADRRSG